MNRLASLFDALESIIRINLKKRIEQNGERHHGDFQRAALLRDVVDGALPLQVLPLQERILPLIRILDPCQGKVKYVIFHSWRYSQFLYLNIILVTFSKVSEVSINLVDEKVALFDLLHLRSWPSC